MGLIQRIMIRILARVVCIGILIATLALIAGIFIIALPIAIAVLVAFIAFVLVIMLYAMVRGAIVRRAGASMHAQGRENVRVRRPGIDQSFGNVYEPATSNSKTSTSPPSA